jgi:hypothetical protein
MNCLVSWEIADANAELPSRDTARLRLTWQNMKPPKEVLSSRSSTADPLSQRIPSSVVSTGRRSGGDAASPARIRTANQAAARCWKSIPPAAAAPPEVFREVLRRFVRDSRGALAIWSIIYRTLAARATISGTMMSCGRGTKGAPPPDKSCARHPPGKMHRSSLRATPRRARQRRQVGWRGRALAMPLAL